MRQAEEVLRESLERDPSDAADSNNLDSEAEAQVEQAIDDALQLLAEQQQQSQLAALNHALQRAGELSRQQRNAEIELRRAQQRQLQEREQGRYTPGLTTDRRTALVEEKRNMQRKLESIRDDVASIRNDAEESGAEAAAQLLDQAIGEVDENRTAQMLGISADSIEQGDITTQLPAESLVTNSIREFRDLLDEAAQALQTAPTDWQGDDQGIRVANACLLYTSPSPRDRQKSRMPSSA